MFYGRRKKDAIYLGVLISIPSRERANLFSYPSIPCDDCDRSYLGIQTAQCFKNVCWRHCLAKTVHWRANLLHSCNLCDMVLRILFNPMLVTLFLMRFGEHRHRVHAGK